MINMMGNEFTSLFHEYSQYLGSPKEFRWSSNVQIITFRAYKRFLWVKLCACVLSRVWLFATLWTVACQAPLSMGFSRQEYWSGLPCPHQGDFPCQRIKPMSLVPPALQADSLPLSYRGSPNYIFTFLQ